MPTSTDIVVMQTMRTPGGELNTEILHVGSFNGAITDQVICPIAENRIRLRIYNANPNGRVVFAAPNAAPAVNAGIPIVPGQAPGTLPAPALWCEISEEDHGDIVKKDWHVSG